MPAACLHARDPLPCIAGCHELFKHLDGVRARTRAITRCCRFHWTCVTQKKRPALAVVRQLKPCDRMGLCRDGVMHIRTSLQYTSSGFQCLSVMSSGTALSIHPSNRAPSAPITLPAVHLSWVTSPVCPALTYAECATYTNLKWCRSVQHGHMACPQHGSRPKSS